MNRRDKIIAVILLALIVSSISLLFLYVNALDRINSLRKELIWDLGKALKQGSLDIGAVAFFLNEYCIKPFNGNLTMFEIVHPGLYATTIGTLTRSVDDMTWASTIAYHLYDLGMKDMFKVMTAVDEVQERLIRISNLMAGKNIDPSNVKKIADDLNRIADILSEMVNPISSGEVPEKLIQELRSMVADLYHLSVLDVSTTRSAQHSILQAV